MEALQPERNASHNPLFQVLFNHQSEIRSVTPEVQLEDLRLEGLAWDGQTAQFDLTLDIQEDENGIWASFDYATDLFDASTVERLAGHWRNLLRGIGQEQEREGRRQAPCLHLHAPPYVKAVGYRLDRMLAICRWGWATCRDPPLCAPLDRRALAVG